MLSTSKSPQWDLFHVGHTTKTDNYYRPYIACLTDLIVYFS